MRTLIVLQIAVTIAYSYSAGLQSFLTLTPGSELRHRDSVRAVQYIIRAFVLKHTNILTLSFQDKSYDKSVHFGTMLDEILNDIDYVKVQINGGTDTISSANGNRLFHVLLVNDFEGFKSMDIASGTKESNTNELYLVFLIGSSCVDELEKIFQYFWSHFIVNVSILLETNPQNIELYSYFPFSEAHCRNANPILINRFVNDTPSNGDAMIFPNKLQNLGYCPLRAALWDSPPYFRIDPTRRGLLKFVDFEGKLLRVLARKLNFSLDYVVPPNDEQRGKRYPNGSTNGAMKLLQNHEVDLSLGSFRYTLERSNVLTAALPYYQTWQVFGVLRTSLPYTSVEILMFPFHITTWFCLLSFVGIVLAFAVLTVSHNTIIAGGIFQGFSLSNLVTSLLGVSIPRLPRRNFTRCLLVMWIVFAFVMRSAYQSLLFKLLQSNLYRKPPNRLEELVTRGYTLVMTRNTFDSVKTIPVIQNNEITCVIIDSSSESSTFAYVERTPGRFAGVSPMDFWTFYAMTESGRGNFHILPEKIFTQHITVYFAKHSFLIERLDELLVNLRSSGLIDFWAAQSLDMTYFGNTKGRAAAGYRMSLAQLKGLFDVYLILISIAFAVFLLEVLSGRLGALKNILKNKF